MKTRNCTYQIITFNNEIAILWHVFFQEKMTPLSEKPTAASKETNPTAARPVLFADLSSVLRSALATFETPGSYAWFMSCVFFTKQFVKRTHFHKMNWYLETLQLLRKKWMTSTINHIPWSHAPENTGKQKVILSKHDMLGRVSIPIN